MHFGTNLVRFGIQKGLDLGYRQYKMQIITGPETAYLAVILAKNGDISGISYLPPLCLESG